MMVRGWWVGALAAASLVGGCGFLSTEEDEGSCTGTIGGAPVELRLRAGRSSYRIDDLNDDALLRLRYDDGAGHEVDVDVGRIDTYGLPTLLEETPLFDGAPPWIVSWEERALAPTSGTLLLSYLTDYDVEGRFGYELGGDDRLLCYFQLSRPMPTSSGGSSDWD